MAFLRDKFGRAGFIAAFFMLLASHASAAESPLPALADVVAAFDHAILQGQSRVSKWPLNQVLRLKATSALNAAESRTLDDAVGMLGRQTRLTVRRDDGAAEAEIVVELVDGLGSRGAGIHNVGRTHSSYASASGDMQSATISIARDWSRRDPALIERTLPHEMLHAVGFHGHTPDGFDSVMSGIGGSARPTDWDRLFLAVLYDERLPLGTPRIFALPIVCDLLHERLAADRRPRIADPRARGPHPYCAGLAPRQVSADQESDRVAIAWAYLHGLGVARDLDAAERWARQSKASGDRDADYLLYSLGRARIQQ